MADLPAAVRRFNRTVTQQVSALGRPLPGLRPAARRGPDCCGRSARTAPRSGPLGSAGYREIGAYNDNPYARHWFEKHLG